MEKLFGGDYKHNFLTTNFYLQIASVEQVYMVDRIYQTGIFGRLHLPNRQKLWTVSNKPIGSKCAIVVIKKSRRATLSLLI